MMIQSQRNHDMTRLTLDGRLDAAGSGVFEKQAAELAGDTRFVVVDMANVPFLSSIGIRALIALERRLRAREGYIILAGVQPFVSEVLKMAGVLDQLRTAASADDALRVVEQARQSAASVREQTVNGRAYRVHPLSDQGALFAVWSHEASGDGLSAEQLTGANLEELGLAFGVGGFGVNREEALGALGEFISTRTVAAITPADGHNLADLLVAAKPESTVLYVRDAISLPGQPTHYIESPDYDGTVQDLLRDLAALVGDGEFGIALLGRSDSCVGRYYAKAGDIAQDHSTARDPAGEGTIFLVGVKAEGSLFHGHGLLLDKPAEKYPRQLKDVLSDLADPEPLRDVLDVDDESTRIRAPRIWLFTPLHTVSGRDQQLKIEIPEGTHFPDEWDVVVRQIYADSGRVKLKPLHGGYTSATFQVESDDKAGRRMIPTVLKVSSLPITEREERAYHDCVKKFILNNSTVIMGKAERGNWSGLRYNFVGVNGPESQLTWLADHYVKRPMGELKPLFDSLFLQVLWPWYGQPAHETIRPFVDHNPAGMFKLIAQHGEEVLGVKPDAETVACPELGRDLPNPYRFYLRGYDRYKDVTRDWYTSITHGDLNLNNILLDEKENIYVIDFSETCPRNIVSDFARLEPLLTVQMTRLESEQDAAQVLGFLAGLLEPDSIRETPPFRYDGDDPLVRKAYDVICLLRGYAAKASRDQDDLLAYLLPLLQWTMPIVSFIQLPVQYKRLSMLASALICEKIQGLMAK